MRRLQLIRHGQSAANVANLVVSNPMVGCPQYGLSDEGRHVCASIVLPPCVSKIIHSPFLRTAETAAIVRANCATTATLVSDARLQERAFGKFDMHSADAYPNVWERDKSDATHEWEGVESCASVCQRLLDFLRNGLQDTDDSVAIVSHGDTLQILQSIVHGVHIGRHREFAMQPGEVREIVVPKLHRARVKVAEDLEEATRRLELNVLEGEERDGVAAFSFLPGQWVDFWPLEDNLKLIGGYSMTSAPSCLPTVELAVQRTQHPAAQAVHALKKDDIVHIRVGGSFAFSSGEAAMRGLLLIAGGIGVNPLISIVRHIETLEKESERPSHVVLLYSAKTRAHFLFREYLDNRVIDVTLSPMKVIYVLTENGGRIAQKNIDEALGFLGDKPLCYLCGPNQMSEDISRVLTTCGVDERDIRYEKWWLTMNVVPSARCPLTRVALTARLPAMTARLYGELASTTSTSTAS
eukprot:GEMP01029556.1.p1 GENE.GEMP01029556.1~~GEMP01029556.1.p1  ORF type:complete len:467 (+),score=95.83 GEMP01029556.1:51-1451(+)